MKYVYKANLERFVQYAIRVWDVEANPFKPDEAALEGIRRTKEFFKYIGAPTSFAEAGLPVDRIEEMAEKCCRNRKVGQFMPLSKEDIVKIYELAIE